MSQNKKTSIKKSIKKFLPLGVSLIVFCFTFFCFLFFSNFNDFSDLGYSRVFVNSKYRGQLYFSSFFESFYNLRNISEQENVYYEKNLSALMFAPDFEYKDCDSSSDYEKYFSDFYLNEFPETKTFNNGSEIDYLDNSDSFEVETSYINSDYYDKRCLASNCLEQRGLNLFLDGQALSLPGTVKDVVALSIGLVDGSSVSSADDLVNNLESLDNKSGFFLIGLTIKEEDSYRGLVYQFKDGEFIQVLKEREIISPYFGLFGFGGEVDDFLVIYGAEKGLAYRLKSGAENPEDISHFFDFRVMNDGFKAEAIKLEQAGRANFYIFSLSSGRPTLIKLWENKPELGISGGVVLNNSMKTNDLEDGKILFKKLTTKELAKFAIPANLNNDLFLLTFNNNDCQVFYDYGFKNENEGFFISNQHFSGADNFFSRIRTISILDLKLDRASAFLVGENSPRLFFQMFKEKEFSQEDNLGDDLLENMNDSLTNNLLASPWQEIKKLEGAELIKQGFNAFIIKVIFPAQSDKFYSPFLEEVTFNYYYSKE